MYPASPGHNLVLRCQNLPCAVQSDSANLDNVAELMVRTGVDLEEALMVLVPEAYRNHPDLMANYPEVCPPPHPVFHAVSSFSCISSQSFFLPLPYCCVDSVLWEGCPSECFLSQSLSVIDLHTAFR